MKRKVASQKTGDWRDNILDDLPQTPVRVSCRTYPDALEVIRVAAFNRRMTVADFIARAALAVAVHDHGDVDWHEVSEKEPPMVDLRRGRLPAKRLRGNGFGPWRIERMSE